MLENVSRIQNKSQSVAVITGSTSNQRAIILTLMQNSPEHWQPFFLFTFKQVSVLKEKKQPLLVLFFARFCHYFKLKFWVLMLVCLSVFSVLISVCLNVCFLPVLTTDLDSHWGLTLCLYPPTSKIVTALFQHLMLI